MSLIRVLMAVCLLSFFAGRQVALAEDPQPIIPTTGGYLSISGLGDNAFGSDPAVPRTVSFNVQYSPGWGLTPNASYQVDFGDGEVSSQTNQSPSSVRTFSHTYGTPGPKTVRLLGTFSNSGSQYPIYQGDKRTLIGTPVHFDAEVECTPLSGEVPLAVSITIDLPPNVTQAEIQNDRNNQRFVFTPNQLTSTITFQDPAVYKLSWYYPACWTADAVYVLQQPDIMLYAGVGNSRPTPGASFHLANVNSSGNDFYARIPTDGSKLYFISDRTGANQIYEADLTNQIPPQFSAPRLVDFSGWTPPGGACSFEISGDAETMVVTVPGPTGNGYSLIAKWNGTRFDEPYVMSIQTRGVTWVNVGGEDSECPDWIYDVSEDGNEIYTTASSPFLKTYVPVSGFTGMYEWNGSRLGVDLAPRRSSTTGTTRAWHGPDGIYAMIDGQPGSSVYSIYDDEGAYDHFRWFDFEQGPGSGASVGCLSDNGRWMFLSKSAADSLGHSDLYVAEIPDGGEPVTDVFEFLLTDPGALINEDVDYNADDLVDASDCRMWALEEY